MRKNYSNCVVPGCKNSQLSSRHGFPRKNWGFDIFRTWLLRINNPKLKYMTRREISRRCVICDRHFTDECKVPGLNILKFGATPTLHLPNYPPNPDLKFRDIWPGGFSINIDLSLDKESNHQMVDDCDVQLNLTSFPSDIIESVVPTYTEDYQLSSKIFELALLEQENNNTSKESTQVPENSVLQTESDINLTNEISILEKQNSKSLTSLLFGSKCIGEVCRICLCSLSLEEIIKNLHQSQTNPQQIANMVKLVLPDLDLNMYEKNSYCKRCLELLGYSFELREKWLTAEEKLQKIIKKQNEANNNKTVLEIVPNETIAVQLFDHSYYKSLDTEESPKIIQVETKVKRAYHKADYLRLGPGPYLCEKCGRIYNLGQSFRKHQRLHRRENIEKEKHICEICGRELSSAQWLKWHLKKHEEQENAEPKSYECNRCKKIFKKKVALNLHIKYYHLRLYNYAQCHLCGKKLCSSNSLRLHMKIHGNKKNFKCTICDKSFYLARYLNKHQRRHSKEKLLCCEHCGKAIKYEVSLKNHIKVFHMGGGDHVCDICKRPYTKKSSLESHKIRVHGWSPHLEK